MKRRFPLIALVALIGATLASSRGLADRGPEMPTGADAPQPRSLSAAEAGTSPSFANLQRGDIKRRVAEADRGVGQSRPDMHRMLAANDRFLRRGSDPLISSELEQWNTSRFAIDLDSGEGFLLEPGDDARSRRESTARRRPSKDVRRSDSSALARAETSPPPTAEAASEEPVVAEAGEQQPAVFLSSLSPQVRFALAAVPVGLGCLFVAIYLAVLWRKRQAERQRSKQPAMLLGLVDPAPAPTAQVTGVARRHDTEAQPEESVPAAPKRRAA